MKHTKRVVASKMFLIAKEGFFDTFLLQNDKNISETVGTETFSSIWIEKSMGLLLCGVKEAPGLSLLSVEKGT